MRSILTIDAGSSSLRFALFGLVGMVPAPLMRGAIDGLGAAPRLRILDCCGEAAIDAPIESGAALDAGGALAVLIGHLSSRFRQLEVIAVGHRVVHGGHTFSTPVALTDEAIGALADLIPLAPLHQPFNLKAAQAAREAFPGVPQIACFDSAFHAGHAFEQAAFGPPGALFDEGIRRDGFYGLSHEYVAREMARMAPAVAEGRMVVAHLGKEASLCAIRDGRSIACTMGFSALDDREGGLKVLSEPSHHMCELDASDDPRAAQAIACFVARVRREIGAMTAVLGGLDALVFTGGIGENSARVRSAVASGLDWLGVALDGAANEDKTAVELSSLESRVRVFRVQSDEEAMIARHVVGLMAAAAADLVPLDRVAWVA